MYQSIDFSFRPTYNLFFFGSEKKHEKMDLNLKKKNEFKK